MEDKASVSEIVPRDDVQMQKFETEQFNWAYKENYINHEPSMSDIVPRDDVHMQKFDT